MLTIGESRPRMRRAPEPPLPPPLPVRALPRRHQILILMRTSAALSPRLGRRRTGPKTRRPPTKIRRAARTKRVRQPPLKKKRITRPKSRLFCCRRPAEGRPKSLQGMYVCIYFRTFFLIWYTNCGYNVRKIFMQRHKILYIFIECNNSWDWLGTSFFHIGAG
jgi:hypothetical protein